MPFKSHCRVQTAPRVRWLASEGSPYSLLCRSLRCSCHPYTFTCGHQVWCVIRRPQHADHTAVCSDLGLLCVGLCHVKLSHFLPRGGVPHTGETLLSECPHPRPPGLCSVPVSFTALQSVEVGFLSVQPPMITDVSYGGAWGFWFFSALLQTGIGSKRKC